MLANDMTDDGLTARQQSSAEGRGCELWVVGYWKPTHGAEESHEFSSPGLIGSHSSPPHLTSEPTYYPTTPPKTNADSMARHSIAQHSIAQHNIAQYSTAQHTTA